MAYRKDWGQPQQGGQGFARTVKTLGRRIPIAAADNVTNNVIGAFTVPPGFVVTGILAIASDMDSGGTPALAISVGDPGNAARYLSASTIGQGGTTATALAAAGLLFKNFLETEIQILIATQSQTAVAGTLDLYLTGFIDN